MPHRSSPENRILLISLWGEVPSIVVTSHELLEGRLGDRGSVDKQASAKF